MFHFVSQQLFKTKQNKRKTDASSCTFSGYIYAIEKEEKKCGRTDTKRKEWLHLGREEGEWE